MANIEAEISRDSSHKIPFVFDAEKVLAPDNISATFATHGMWLAAQSFRERMNILDLGSGSGIQAVAALLSATGEGEYNITAVDIDDTALETTQANLERASKFARSSVGFQVIKSNWLSAVDPQGFDLILSNPPYLDKNTPISYAAASTAPIQAMYSDHSVDAYQQIIPKLRSYLTDFGIAVMRTQLGDTQQDLVRDIVHKNRLTASGLGTHDGQREGTGLTIYGDTVMPPGLHLPHVPETVLKIEYEGMYDGGSVKELTETGKYWHAVMGIDPPEVAK